MSGDDKRAAIELHGLVARDREWVLGQLGPEPRSRLMPLLEELDGMNLRFDLESLTAADDREAVTPRESSADGAADETSSGDVIRDATPAQVLDALVAEPAWIVSSLLARDAWPWCTQVSKALHRNGVQRVEPSLEHGDPPMPPAFAAALERLLRARLRNPRVLRRANGSASGDQGTLNGSSVWGRLLPKVRQWLR